MLPYSTNAEPTFAARRYASEVYALWPSVRLSVTSRYCTEQNEIYGDETEGNIKFSTGNRDTAISAHVQGKQIVKKQTCNVVDKMFCSFRKLGLPN